MGTYPEIDVGICETGQGTQVADQAWRLIQINDVISDDNLSLNLYIVPTTYCIVIILERSENSKKRILSHSLGKA